MNKILYPDGSWGQRPFPTQREYDPITNQNYTWDDVIEKWVDYKGDIFYPTEKKLPTQISLWDSVQDFVEPEVSATRTESKSNGCDCGVWATDSDRHSTWCKLYNPWRDK